MNSRQCLAPCCFALLIAPCCIAAPLTGYIADAEVEQATRIDWVFTLANQSPADPPADWVQDYDSTEQTYECFVPKSYRQQEAHPLILFISPGDRGTSFKQWQETCSRQGILFAGPHKAGNRCPMERRVHIVLDVLDDMRRKYNIDPDRTYISGFSGGGRIACAIGFAVPEYFGGVIPICAGGELRQESWLRQRVIDRLSVAHLTGSTDFNRGEVERLRSPMLKEVGVRSRAWVVPKLGHGVPSTQFLTQAYKWLEEARKERAALAKKYPASRVADSESPPDRKKQAKDLLTEARQRVRAKTTRYSGLMQLKGLSTRWPDLPQSVQAKRLLLEFEQGEDRSWEEEDIAEQRRFLVARARSLDAYASGPLANQYEPQRVDMAKAAIELWQTVINDGQDAKAVADAEKRLPKLRQLVADE